MKGKLLLLIICFSVFLKSFGQEEKKAFTLNGYISDMGSIMFDSLKSRGTLNNLVHSRLNLKIRFSDKSSFGAEMRNRLYTGDMVSGNASYSHQIGLDPGLVDLSWNLITTKSVLLNTSVDRLWFDYSSEKFQITLGRQRINWGQTFVWNPNDIFNAYSFFDFDYVERPGSDALRIQFFPTFSSAVELAVKADNEKDITAASLFRFNKWGYDIQFLAGVVNSRDFVAGAGWSGAIKSLSFRGEFSWFTPIQKLKDTSGTGLFTVGIDKVFKNNSSAQLQVMYCNQPVSLTDFNAFYSGNLSSKELAFSRFSAFGQFTLAATPLLNIGISGMWLPDLKGYFTGLSVDYSVSENIDISLIWQHFYTGISAPPMRINLGFLRVKYSF